VEAAASFTIRPTRVEPVNDTTLTRGSVVIAVPLTISVRCSCALSSELQMFSEGIQ